MRLQRYAIETAGAQGYVRCSRIERLLRVGRHRKEDIVRPAVRLVIVLMSFHPASVWADETSGTEPGYGVAAGAFLSKFIGGDSGPETPLSDTAYGDTFQNGGGVRVEGYRDFGSGWRAQVGLVHAQWSGKHFVGGEFPGGAQFGDFSLTGMYLGGRIAADRASGLVPYVLGNFGLVRLSSLSVQSAGAAMPYWSDTWRDYLELGAGVAWKLRGASAITVDLRLQAFGKPTSVNFPIAEATGGQSLLLNVGYEWGLQ
jgi:hypothetical protein